MHSSRAVISGERGGQRKHGVYIGDEVGLPCAVKNATRTVILAWHPRSSCPSCQFLLFTRAELKACPVLPAP